jgi:hypothetical protein
MKECPKWQTSYASYKKDGSKKHGNEASVIDLEEDGQATMAMRSGQGVTNYPSKMSSVMLQHLHWRIL